MSHFIYKKICVNMCECLKYIQLININNFRLCFKTNITSWILKKNFQNRIAHKCEWCGSKYIYENLSLCVGAKKAILIFNNCLVIFWSYFNSLTTFATKLTSYMSFTSFDVVFVNIQIMYDT